jgi:eukaryotic-like serine/threonine-protein kinase
VSIELTERAVIAGRYRLERLLGQGGMGVVWAAVHTVTGKRVALKFVRGSTQRAPELRRRFLREARAASAVAHPNVVGVHDVFELDAQTLIMVMDLLEGETLGQRLAREEALPLGAAADILIQVVSAVGAAHAAGVVHRDLKPDNVFLVTAGTGTPDVRVLDFGIAKLVVAEGVLPETANITGSGAILGTPSYMSPEQACGERDLDHRTDVWSIGAILYECLSGARPIDGENMGQVVKRLLTGVITPLSAVVPSVPADIDDLVRRMLTRNPDGRPSDLREVFEVLAGHASVTAPSFGCAAPSQLDLSISSGGELPAFEEIHPADAPAARPQTIGAHSIPGRGRSVQRRSLWIFVALAALGASLVLLVRRSSQEQPRAVSAASRAQSSAQPSAAPPGAPSPRADMARPPDLSATPLKLSSPKQAPGTGAEHAVRSMERPSRALRPLYRASAAAAESARADASAAAPATSASAAAPKAPRRGLEQNPPF